MNAKAKKEQNLDTQLDSLRVQMFEMKLAKSISGTFDRKKYKDLKKQVVALYAANK